MIRPVKLRPRAEADLDGIWDYTVDTWSEAQAVDYLSGMDAALKLLAEFPEMARLRQEFTPPVRIHPYRKHLIIYIADDGFIDVVRVVHAQANWSVFLTE
ncbi:MULTISPECIES: type II toxin-antitoxin system RelE/ParE family toxin [unclassified Roseovarius]|uniref:type II toxin-antitoxin system RelE/ParE family toxin n=1 Tax=unclassified Roseovarius TaxID=2614913 RepID=UPI00273D8047|nr:MULTISPECIES: type II toxin-antitoxin system RelE/ParE family toxin [unclassified Roseovarius]